MPTLWFVLVGFMLTMYVVLDGFDLGVGALHLVVARTEGERRAVLRAIGPVWDGNEVWLIAAGGTLFFSFPLLYASSFSGFYLPLFIVLWLLMGRGVAIELRSHLAHPVWAAFWDGIFSLTSVLLIVFYGAALGNVVRGVPLDQRGYFFEPLWTDFSPSGTEPGILDWYTVLIGLLAVAALAMHGATYLAVKTGGALGARARHLTRQTWLATLGLTAVTTVATFALRPALLSRFGQQPWGVIFPLLALGGLATLGYLCTRRSAPAPRQEVGAFLASTAYLAGMLASTAFALYPDVLPAVHSSYSLTVHNAAASSYGLGVGLAWWSIGMVLAALYFVLTYRLFRGKIVMEGAEQSHY